MNTKYIFIDIDGTLVGYDAVIPESALKAIRLANKNGHKIFIASGRSYSIIYKELIESGLFAGVVSSGGAAVHYNNKILFKSNISGEALNEITKYFKDNSIIPLALTENKIYAEKDFTEIAIPAMRKYNCSEDLIQRAYGGVITVDDIRQVEEIEKFQFFMSKKPLDVIRNELGNRYCIVDYSIGKIRNDSYFGEITHADVNKATAIERVMKHVNAPISDSIAIGDSGNDLDMIKFAGVGVAMGNATEQIKKAADFVTTDVDKDGIFNAFKALGLI